MKTLFRYLFVSAILFYLFGFVISDNPIYDMTHKPNKIEYKYYQKASDSSEKKDSSSSYHESYSDSGVTENLSDSNDPKDLQITEGNLNVNPGEYATISAHTIPNEEITIYVEYNSGQSTAKGLEPKLSDSNGNVTFKWLVGQRTEPGNYTVEVAIGNLGVDRTLIVN